MSQATVQFQLAAESVTSVLDINLGGVVINPISGNISGVLGAAHIVGDIDLTGNVYSEGLLTGIDTFRIRGNGFTWFFQNGGGADLHGKVKAPWGPWGTSSVGWVAGDRLAVSPTKQTVNAAGTAINGVFVPSELVWSNWSATRPVNSPDVTLVDGTVAKPEVVNLSQSIVIENLLRGFHFHDSAGVQKLSDVKFLNCGQTGVLGNYPCHFHLLGESSRGSLLERVVVEGGKNHAFVPHGSHGITFKDCVAYNTISDAFWWDPPLDNDLPSSNDTNDVLYDHCLALKVNGPPGGPTAVRLTGYLLGRGNNNRCVNSVAAGVIGGKSSSGFMWPETGIAVWGFNGCAAHNNKSTGIFTWSNTKLPHVVEGFKAYHCARAGIEHGAYRTSFVYRNVSLTVTRPIATGGAGDTAAIMQHANGGETGLLFEDVLTDDRLTVHSHGLPPSAWAIFRRCTFSGVVYKEVQTDGGNIFRSENRFEDCGLTPADFTLTSILSDSTIEIYEGGLLVHRWAGGWV